MRKNSGFTLIELMVTISVLAILVSVGIPSMRDFVRNNRRAAAVNLLVTDIQRARSTAAGQGRNVILCRATTATGCATGTGSDWANGWLSYIDIDADDVLDPTDTILAIHSGLDAVRMPSNKQSLTFYPGFRRISANGTIAVCVDESDSNGRWIVISNTGRPRLQTLPEGGISCN